MDKYGKVTGITSGSVVITATSASGVSDSLSFTIKDAIVPVTKIDIDSVVSVEAGKSILINSKIYPNNATNKNIVWQVEDTSIAKVSSSGVVTGIKDGSTVVTATIGNVISSTTVFVKEIKAEKIELNYEQVDLYSGEEITLKGTLLPSNVTNTNITWISSDENIVTVKNGIIKALSIGETTVTVTNQE